MSLADLRMRVRLCCSSRGAAIIASMREHNGRLQKIVGWSEVVQPANQRRQQTSAVSYYDQIQRLCQSSYAALRDCWRCLCHDDHVAEIFVGASQKTFSISSLEELPVTLILSNGANTSDYHVTVRRQTPVAVTDPVQTNTLPQQPQPGSLYQSASSMPTTSILRQKIKSSIKFGKTPAAVTGAGYSQTANMVIQSNMHPTFNLPAQVQAALQQPKIGDLCFTLRTMTLCSNNGCYGSLEDPQQNAFTMHAATLPSGPVRLVSSIVEAPDFGTRQRLSLAISVMIALLQSHSTPWNRSSAWTKDVVRFSGDNTSVRIVLSSDFRANTTTAASSAVPYDPKVEDETYKLMQNLAVLLLEILYRKPIETLRTASGMPDVVSNAEVVKSQVDWHDVAGQVGDKIMQALRNCVWTNFQGTSPNLAKKDFRKWIHESIITHLQTYYDYMWS